MPHQREAMEQGDVLGLGRGRHQRHHPVNVGLGKHPRRVLRVDQDDVRADRLQADQPLVQSRSVRRHSFVAQHRIRAGLPQHQVGLLRDHGRVEAGEHVGGLLAVHAAVENREFLSGEVPGEFLRQPARIGSRR